MLRRLRYWIVLLTLATAASAISADDWSASQLVKAREFSETLDTAAVVILQDGEVVNQWGAVALPLKCHSVRKSLLSALYGVHVENGAVDLDSSLAELGMDDNEPSLSDEERSATIGDLLKARSGVYHPALYEMAAKRPQRGSHPPNTFWYYNNWDFNAAGTIFENLTGRSLFEEFETRIARPLELQDFRRRRDTRYVTGDDSVHPAYPFLLSARDLARFGQLMLQSGRWGSEQIVPAEWVRESTTSYSSAGASGGYGYMWWVAVDGNHFPGVTLPPESYSARGHRGQYLVIIPEWKVVICHRVNSFQKGTAVSKSEFGKLLAMILAARAESVDSEREPTDWDAKVTFDVIIRSGEVIDGTGRERFRADVGIKDGLIVSISDLGDATGHRTIDARGKLVCPGFIDLHSHAEEGLVHEDPARRSAPNLITQGITTVVVNQDGGGPLDLNDQRTRMQHLGVGLNVIQTLGHGTIRREVMGDDFRRPASPTEIEAMLQLLRSALQSGAFGMSTGLEYVPGRWSTTREMEALSNVIAEFDGVSIVHERSSGSRPMWFLPSRDSADQPSMLDNIRELIDIAASTNARTVATHIKARGTDFWGSSEQMNELLQRARDDGLPIFADQYPYNTSGSDGRIVLIPDWVFQTSEEQASDGGESVENAERETDYANLLKFVLDDREMAGELRQDIEYEIARRGGTDSILIVEHMDASISGKTLAELATIQQQSPIDTVITLQLQGDTTSRGGARLRAFSMSENDVEAFAQTPWTATSSDAGIALPEDGPVHPRYYGAFPRKIRHYAIDRGLMSIEEAVRVSTSLPATILGLHDRGTIDVNKYADLVIFDPETIRDAADAFNPHQLAEGIGFVLVNGEVTVESGSCIGSLAGNVIVKSSSPSHAKESSSHPPPVSDED